MEKQPVWNLTEALTTKQRLFSENLTNLTEDAST